MYGAFGFVKVQNPRGTGELRQIDKDDGKTPGNSEVDFRSERYHNFALLLRLFRREWRQCYSAEETNVSSSQNQIDLTPTGLLMEGDSTSVRFPFAIAGLNEFY